MTKRRKMKRKLRNIIIAGLAGVLFLQNAPTVDAAFLNALEITPESTLKAHLENSLTTVSIPNSIDLSTSKYFPQIQSQGQLGSCAAFSTTYYQFTYEANKLNNIDSKVLSNSYSPKWTYTALNKGNNQGISIENAYVFLSEHGALKWNDFLYDGTPTVAANYQAWPTDTAKMREALNTRLENWDSYSVSGTGTVITSNQSTALKKVKSVLASGKVLQISTYHNWDVGTNTYGQVSYRCYKGNSGHSMIIVGYDDNVYYDVNGNGVIEAAEKGAFKIANSWGTYNNNSGYLWVLYDALNAKSAISGTWESKCTGTRTPAFAYGTTDNYFTSMDVEKKTVNYVAQVSLTAQRRDQLKIGIGKSIKNATTSSVSHEVEKLGNGGSLSYTGTLVYDFGTVMTNFNKEYTGYKWYLTIGDNYFDGYSLANINYAVTDNLGNVVKQYGSISSKNGTTTTAGVPIALEKGDVDYDGDVTLTDAQIVLKYSLRTLTPSNAQKLLADYDGNGVIDQDDAQAVLRVALRIS